MGLESVGCADEHEAADATSPFVTNGAGLVPAPPAARTEDLKLSDRILDDFFDLAPDLFVIVDVPSGKVRRANASWETTLGYTPEEIVGLDHFLDLVHPDDLPRARDEYRGLLENRGLVLKLEVRHRHKDGSYRWAQWRVVHRGDALFGIGSDVTHVREMERERRESEELFRLMAEELPIGVILGRDGDTPPHFPIIEYANTAAAAMHGTTPDQLIGTSVHKLIEPASLPAKVESLGSLRATGRARLVLTLLRGDGSTFEADMTSRQVTLGGRRRCLSVYEDVTGKRGTEKRLKESEQLFRMLFEDAPTPMCLSTSDGTILKVNEEGCAFIGFSKEEIEGQNFRSMTHPESLDANSRQYERLASGEIDSYRLEVAYTHKQGHTVWGDLQASRLCDHEHKLDYIVCQMQDISRQKAEEAQMRRAREDAEAASRAKSDFLATLSHEIRTPLTAILGLTEILKESRDVQAMSPRRQFEIDTVHENAHMLLRIVNDLLDLARVEAGKLDLELGPCAPMRLVSDVVAMMHPRARSRGLVLSAECDSEVPALIQSDETRLRQVLINLVGNAIKFTEKGEVRVRAKCVRLGSGERGLEISVADTGLGMSPKEAAAAFELFVRGNNSQARRAGGTGLGLPICRRLAERLGGTIGVETEPGQGSVFRLVIPIGLEGEAEAIKAEADPSGPPAPAVWGPAGLRVMLVEDNEANRFVGVYRLEEAGAEVITATNGQEALDRFHEAQQKGEPFDLILMDLQMPVLDGYEACRQLRGLGYDRPLIALTAYAMNEDRDECLRLGFDAHVSKPIDWARLMERIESLVTGPRVKAG